MHKLKPLKIRLWQWLAIATGLTVIIALIAPQQIAILLLKATNVTAAIFIGYWADRIIFDYARPNELLKEAKRDGTSAAKQAQIECAYHAYALAMLRRAIIVSAVVIAFALGL